MISGLQYIDGEVFESEEAIATALDCQMRLPGLFAGV